MLATTLELLLEPVACEIVLHRYFVLKFGLLPKERVDLGFLTRNQCYPAQATLLKFELSLQNVSHFFTQVIFL